MKKYDYHASHIYIWMRSLTLTDYPARPWPIKLLQYPSLFRVKKWMRILLHEFSQYMKNVCERKQIINLLCISWDLDHFSDIPPSQGGKYAGFGSSYNPPAKSTSTQVSRFYTLHTIWDNIIIRITRKFYKKELGRSYRLVLEYSPLGSFRLNNIKIL